MAAPESNPLWDVDCFSLSARPQVRWRERRRCDYQKEVQVDEKAMNIEENPATQSQQDSKPPVNQHTRILIRRDDSTYDINQYQTQC